MRLFTIGFTKKTARDFFGKLREAGVRRVIDVRLANVSQLAGFAKKDDLAFFLREIGGIAYVHRPELAPTEELLRGYRRKTIGWAEYEERFRRLLQERQVEAPLSRQDVDGACLLCSEPSAARCHRRLVAEYLKEKWERVEIIHL
ncbi:MAG: DUF488 domain-containing protein [Planctomycetes bacterium]|nr:DUF488 domain-containing protein [Planctomycetota bacterium]